MATINHSSWLLLISLFLVISLFGLSDATATYHVVKYGAKADGKTDSTQAFLKTWEAACSSTQTAIIYVPKGRFLLKAAEFRGPCKSRIIVQIYGTLIAPTDYWALGNSGYWILFIQVNNLGVFGARLDAKGAGFWACRKSGKSCPVGARSITFNWVNNVVISDTLSINSQLTHLVINSCKNVVVRNVKLYAPDDSPNTDGIHVRGSTGVTITRATLMTGDDCVSIGPGTKNLKMNNINCGPGHGISIGSLARNAIEAGVEDVTLTNAVFTGSDNGLRIKTWARPSTGYVANILFQNIVMKNVKNPIIIDQNYCPRDENCPNQTSGVKISQVRYKNIQGTSATAEAVTFDCSPSNPCKGIALQDIKLTYLDKVATSSCNNIDVTSTGVLMPQSCAAT
ncbi:polygalacturonase-like [Argentina anserina]|uniref:polygalacturonase-like n=1 Tax=Argentina anserina TaxID=57926 RepID=UPI0021767DD0|nr:polygalacturonase-like [Potentilla anserina]